MHLACTWHDNYSRIDILLHELKHYSRLCLLSLVSELCQHADAGRYIVRPEHSRSKVDLRQGSLCLFTLSVTFAYHDISRL